MFSLLVLAAIYFQKFNLKTIWIIINLIKLVTQHYIILTNHYNNACHLIVHNITGKVLQMDSNSAFKIHAININSWIILDIVFILPVPVSRDFRINNVCKICAVVWITESTIMGNVNCVQIIPLPLKILICAWLLNVPIKAILL